jgi:hypothetical protein
MMVFLLVYDGNQMLRIAAGVKKAHITDLVTLRKPT